MSLENVAIIVTVIFGIVSWSGEFGVMSVQAETKHALERAAKWVEPLTRI